MPAADFKRLERGIGSAPADRLLSPWVIAWGVRFSGAELGDDVISRFGIPVSGVSRALWDRMILPVLGDRSMLFKMTFRG